MMKNKICERIKLSKMEKRFLIQLLLVFDENRDEMYYEIDTDMKAKKAFDNLCVACGYSNEPEMDAKIVEKCLKKLGS